MGGVFKTIGPDGKVEYSDRHVGAPGSSTQAWRPGDLVGPRTSALMMAAIRGNKELVQLLLQRGADPRLEDRKGQAALAFATKKGQAAVAEVLAAAMASTTSASSAH